MVTALSTGCGSHHALGGGAGITGVHVGGQTHRALSPVIGARLAEPDSSGALLVADLQPVPVRNPARNESVSSLFVLPSVQLRVASVVVRGGIGPSVHVWSGPDAFETFSWGLAAGGSLGLAPDPDSMNGWAVELFGRVAGGIEVSSDLVGIQVVRYLR